MNDRLLAIMYYFLLAGAIITLFGFVIFGLTVRSNPVHQCARSCEAEGKAFMYIEGMKSNDSGTSCQCFEKSIVENTTTYIKR